MIPQSSEARVDPMPWGDTVFKMIRVPDENAAARGPAKGVEGEGSDYPVNRAPAPVIEGVFLWAGARLLDRIGLEPGERLEVRLRPTPDDTVEEPEVVIPALRAAGNTSAREALIPGKRRGLLHAAQSAKRADMRARRIAALVPGLGA